MESNYWMTDIFLDEDKTKFKFVEVETGNVLLRYIDEIEPAIMTRLRAKDASTINFMRNMEMIAEVN